MSIKLEPISDSRVEIDPREIITASIPELVSCGNLRVAELNTRMLLDRYAAGERAGVFGGGTAD
jgi:hypothetical protein